MHVILKYRKELCQSEYCRRVRLLMKIEPERMVIHKRQSSLLEIPNKTFQIPFDFRDLPKFEEFLPVKLENVNMKRVSCKFRVIYTHFNSRDELFPIPSKKLVCPYGIVICKCNIIHSHFKGLLICLLYTSPS